MKKSILQFAMIIPLVLLLCIVFSCQKQGEEMAEEAKPIVDVEADITAIKEILNQYAVACNTGDFDLWISLWADDGVRMAPDAPAVIGKEQIRAMKPVFDQMILDIAITSIEDAKVYGDLGLTRCNYTLDVTPKVGGETIHAMRDGKALTLYERQSDGSWKIVYDCINSNVPPASEKE